MVAQDHVFAITQIRFQTVTLIIMHRQAFVVVVSQGTQQQRRLLRDRQEPLFLRTHRNTCARMRVQNAHRIMTRFMDGAVNHKAGVVHIKRRFIDLFTLQINFE